MHRDAAASVPFARTYQLMRNLSFAAAWAERGELSDFGLLLAYVGDAPNEALFRRFRGMLLPSVAERVGSITYERIAKVLGASGRPEDGRLHAVDRRPSQRGPCSPLPVGNLRPCDAVTD